MKKSILFAIAFLFLCGCVGGAYQSYSTNDIPVDLRTLATHDAILISRNDPQPDPSTYIILGKIWSNRSNFTVFEKRGRGAIGLLREEAMRVGADAIINIEVGESNMGSSASGLAIRFNRERR